MTWHRTEVRMVVPILAQASASCQELACPWLCAVAGDLTALFQTQGNTESFVFHRFHFIWQRQKFPFLSPSKPHSRGRISALALHQPLSSSWDLLYPHYLGHRASGKTFVPEEHLDVAPHTHIPISQGCFLGTCNQQTQLLSLPASSV